MEAWLYLLNLWLRLTQKRNSISFILTTICNCQSNSYSSLPWAPYIAIATIVWDYWILSLIMVSPWNCLSETTFRQSRNGSSGKLFVPPFCHLHFSSKGANWFCKWSLSIMKSLWKNRKNAWNILVDCVLFWFDHKALFLLWISGRQEECSSFSLFQTSRRGLVHCCLPQVKKKGIWSL